MRFTNGPWFHANTCFIATSSVNTANGITMFQGIRFIMLTRDRVMKTPYSTHVPCIDLIKECASLHTHTFPIMANRLDLEDSTLTSLRTVHLRISSLSSVVRQTHRAVVAILCFWQYAQTFERNFMFTTDTHAIGSIVDSRKRPFN